MSCDCGTLGKGGRAACIFGFLVDMLDPSKFMDVLDLGLGGGV